MNRELLIREVMETVAIGRRATKVLSPEEYAQVRGSETGAELIGKCPMGPDSNFRRAAATLVDRFDIDLNANLTLADKKPIAAADERLPVPGEEPVVPVTKADLLQAGAADGGDLPPAEKKAAPPKGGKGKKKGKGSSKGKGAPPAKPAGDGFPQEAAQG